MHTRQHLPEWMRELVVCKASLGLSGSLVLNMALSFLSGRQFAPAFCLSRQTHSFLQQTSEPLLQCQTVHRPGWRCKDNRSYLPAHLLTGVVLDGPQWTTSSIVLRAQLSTLLQETSLLQLQGRTVQDSVRRTGSLGRQQWLGP